MTQISPSPFFHPSFIFPSPPLSLSLPFPFPPSPPRVWGRASTGGGPGVLPPEKMEIETGFGAFWRIFVSWRQLSKQGCSDVRTSEMCGYLIVDVICAKRRTYKLRMTHITGEFFPIQGVILFPWAQFGCKLRPRPPCRRPCIVLIVI